MPKPKPPVFDSRFRLKELFEKRRAIFKALLEERREILLCARNYPVGAERNQLRQKARSLREADGRWLWNNTLDSVDTP
jgi:hypothetical protein